MAPWFVEPLDQLANPEAKEICILAPIGTGKTAMLEAAACYIVAEDPGPTLLVGQTDDMVDEWMETRMHYAFGNTEETRMLMPDNRHKKRKSAIIWPHMNMFATGANMSGLQEKSMRRVFGDEAWQYKKGMMQYARGRLHNRWNRQIWFMSQGSDEESDWHEAWLATDRREFSWHCPGCGLCQPMSFRVNISMDKPAEGQRMEMLERAKTARIVCANPDCDWSCADDQRVRRDLAENAIYVPTHTGLPGHIGFHYSKFFRWSVPLWELCLSWLKSEQAWEAGDHEPRRQYINQELAEFWKPVVFDNETILSGDGYLLAEYADGKAIDNETCRFLTVDVQIDHFWIAVRAWRDDGSSRLLWEGRLVTWEQIEELRAKFGVRNTMTFIDTGYRRDEVYRKCAQYGWLGLKGDQAQGFRAKTKAGKVVERAYTSFRDVVGSDGSRTRFALFSNERCKDMLHALSSGRGASWEKPDDVSQYWRTQMRSEHKAEIVNPKTRQTEWRWVKKARANHLWDCETMQVAAACMMRLIGSAEEE